MRTNNKLNPHVMSSPRIEPGPHWWEASVLNHLACMAGARKGMGKGNRAHGEKEAPEASPLFISSFSFAGKQKNRHWLVFNYASVIAWYDLLIGRDVLEAIWEPWWRQSVKRDRYFWNLNGVLKFGIWKFLLVWHTADVVCTIFFLRASSFYNFHFLSISNTA